MFIGKLRIGRILPLLALAAAVTFTSCDSNEDSAKENMEKASTDVENKVDDAQKEMEKPRAEKMVYSIADVDVQPLFGLECPTKDDPVACSNEEMLKFVKDNAKFPKEASRKGQDGFEQVIVVIEKDGSVSDMKYVASSQTKDCEGCQKAAVDVVAKMKTWTPAKKDGKPVATQITIPVRFES